MADACVTRSTFGILIGGIWILGLLGIICTSIAISNTNKLKKKDRTDKGYNKWFLVVMLIVFIGIICGTSVYGISLFGAAGDPKFTTIGKDARQFYNNSASRYKEWNPRGIFHKRTPPPGDSLSSSKL